MWKMDSFEKNVHTFRERFYKIQQVTHMAANHFRSELTNEWRGLNGPIRARRIMRVHRVDMFAMLKIS